MDAMQYSKLDVENPDVEEQEDTATPEEQAEKQEAPNNKQVPENSDQQDDYEEVDPVEEKARSQGWRPQEEWDGDPTEWVDAKEFVFRGELMDRIRQQSSKINNFEKENKEIKEALKILGEHNKKIAEQEYQKALADLKRQKKEALEDDDYDTVVDIDERMSELKTSKEELDAEKEEATPDTSTEEAENKIPEPVQNWLQSDSNKWYHDDPVMRGAADNVYLQHLQFNPDDFSGALKKVDETMRAYFPEKFTGTKRKGAAVTEPGARGGANKKSTKNSKKATVRDLSDEQKRVAQTFVDSGVFASVQEYVDQLVELGEIE